MNITLKSIQYSSRLSEETACFSAIIYVDGKKAGEASNHGHGGPTSIHPQALFERIEAYAKTLPDVVAFDTTLPYDAELLIGDLLEEALSLKELTRAMSRRVLFTKADQPGIFQSKPVPAARLQAGLAKPDAMKASLKADKILNLLPLPEALALYRADAASAR